MRPFLLEFIDSQAFQVFVIGLAIAAALSAIAVLAGIITLGLRLRTKWRWWKGLDEEAQPAAIRRYFLRKAKNLALIAVLFSVVEAVLYLRQGSYNRAPAVNLQQQNSLREQVVGAYALRDTLLSATTRAAQQGQDGWSPTTTALPPATLAQLVIRQDGTFSYYSRIPADNTPESIGDWRWASLTGHAELLTTYGPVFYVRNNPLQNLWSVKEKGKFSFFGTYKKAEHDLPFELKYLTDKAITTP